jgi:hypothetical protein
VLTHLRMDHCGGLLVDGVRDRLRPDLRVHLAAGAISARRVDLPARDSAHAEYTFKHAVTRVIISAPSPLGVYQINKRATS